MIQKWHKGELRKLKGITEARWENVVKENCTEPNNRSTTLAHTQVTPKFQNNDQICRESACHVVGTALRILSSGSSHKHLKVSFHFHLSLS